LNPSFDELFEKKDCLDKRGKKIGIYNLGDVPFDVLVSFATSILMIYAPSIINKKQMMELLNIKKETFSDEVAT